MVRPGTPAPSRTLTPTQPSPIEGEGFGRRPIACSDSFTLSRYTTRMASIRTLTSTTTPGFRGRGCVG